MRNKTPTQNSRAANSNTTYQNIQLQRQIKYPTKQMQVFALLTIKEAHLGALLSYL